MMVEYKMERKIIYLCVMNATSIGSSFKFTNNTEKLCYAYVTEHVDMKEHVK